MLDVVAPFDDGPDHKYSYGAAPPEPEAVSVTPEEVHKTGCNGVIVTATSVSIETIAVSQKKNGDPQPISIVHPQT